MKIFEQITKDNWTKGQSYDVNAIQVPFHNSNSRSVLGNSEKATHRCLRGWIEFVYQYGGNKVVNEVTEYLKEIGHSGIAIWNDDPERTFPDVLALCLKLNI